MPCCADVVGLAPTALGDPAPVLAAKLSANINAACPGGLNSIVVGNQIWISTRCGASAPFLFRVGPAGTPVSDLCIVPNIELGGPFFTSPAMTCSYNPTLSEEAYPDADANGNGIPDALDIAAGTSVDANQNGIPDEVEGIGPKLNLAVQPNGLQISWQGTGFALQGASTLGPQADWSNLPGATNSPVTVPLDQNMHFFRLINQ